MQGQKVKIFKVHRNNQVFFATYLYGRYMEYPTLKGLCDAIRVKQQFARIFADPIDFKCKAGLQ